jgi:spermidine/putrescine transport system ATP-binding protein
VALTVPATGHAAKGRATLSVRPEKINLGDQAQGVVFEGRITNKNYMGGYTHYTLDVAGTELRASRRNASREGDTIALGATVPVGFVAGSARVLAA